MSDSRDQLIRLASAGRLDLAPSLTTRVPLAEAADALARLKKKIGDPIQLVRTLESEVPFSRQWSGVGCTAL